MLDLNSYRLPAGMTAPAKPKSKPPRFCKAEFLRGPIPWRWLTLAMKLPGRTLAVGLILWREAGILDNRTLPLSHARLRDCGIDRHTARRALRSLEQAGLVKIDRPAGRCLQVTILEVSAPPKR